MSISYFYSNNFLHRHFYLNQQPVNCKSDALSIVLLRHLFILINKKLHINPIKPTFT